MPAAIFRWKKYNENYIKNNNTNGQNTACLSNTMINDDEKAHNWQNGKCRTFKVTRTVFVASASFYLIDLVSAWFILLTTDWISQTRTKTEANV